MAATFWLMWFSWSFPKTAVEQGPEDTATPASKAGFHNDPDVDRLIPRFDKSSASLVSDEGELLRQAMVNQKVIVQIKTRLNAETEGYVGRLTGLLESVVGINEMPSSDLLAMRGQTRELLALLKGNDVWTYVEEHWKRLPERYEIPETPDPRDVERQLIVAFGPPGEWGETNIEVEVDNGQPYRLEALSTFLAKTKNWS